MSQSNQYQVNNTKRKIGEISDSNIYQDPISTGHKKYKKVHKVGDMKVYKQEINSAGQSIGDLRSNVTTQENQFSGR